MSIIGRVKDWATGNSISFANEEKIYTEALNDISAIDTLLDQWIEKHKYTENYSGFRFQNEHYTLVTLEAYINASRMNKDTSMESIQRTVKLKQIREKVILKVKGFLLEKPPKEDFYEVINALTDLKALVQYHKNLPAFKEVEDLDSYDEIIELKDGITLRMSEISPYLRQFEMEEEKRNKR